MISVFLWHLSALLPLVLLCVKAASWYIDPFTLESVPGAVLRATSSPLHLSLQTQETLGACLLCCTGVAFSPVPATQISSTETE